MPWGDKKTRIFFIALQDFEVEPSVSVQNSFILKLPDIFEKWKNKEARILLCSWVRTENIKFLSCTASLSTTVESSPRVSFHCLCPVQFLYYYPSTENLQAEILKQLMSGYRYQCQCQHSRQEPVGHDCTSHFPTLFFQSLVSITSGLREDLSFNAKSDGW